MTTKRTLRALLSATALLTVAGASVGCSSSPEPDAEVKGVTLDRDPTTTSSVGERAALAVWMAGYGTGDTSDLSARMTAVSVAATAQDVPVLRLECERLGQAVVRVQSHPGPPVARLAEEWGSALDSYGRAATLCVGGATSYDAQMMAQANDWFGLGTEAIRRAGAIIGELSG